MQISKEEIVAAALALIEEHGADRLTMRELSHRLGVAPMSIYWYVRSKDALFDLICDEVVAGVPQTPVGRKRWDRALLCIARDTFVALNRHPGVAALAIERLPNENSPNALRLLDLSAVCLRKAGYDDAGAARAALTAYLFVVAHVQYGGRRPGLEMSRVTRPTAGVREHPWIGAMVAAPDEPFDLFEYGFQRLLDGFRAELASVGRRAR